MKNKNRDFDWDKIVHLSLTFGICVFSLSIIFALWANLMRGIWNQIEENKIDAIKLPNSYAVVTNMNWENPKNEIEILLRDGIQNENNEPYFPLSDNERYIVESIVCGEAGNQTYDGKVAVANCILNAAIKDGISVSDVRKQYQYSGWEDINEFEAKCIKAYGNTNLSDEVRQAVSQVFDDGNLIDENILWFYNPKSSNGSFHNTQKFYGKIGDHKFYSPI